MFFNSFLLSISSIPLSFFPSLSLCISLFPNKNDQNPPSPQQTPLATTPIRNPLPLATTAHTHTHTHGHNTTTHNLNQNQNPITNPKPTKSTKTTKSAKTQTKPKIISRDPKSDQISTAIQIHHLPPPRSTGEKERKPIDHRPTNHHHWPTITITTSWEKKNPQNPSSPHPQPAIKPITTTPTTGHKTHNPQLAQNPSQPQKRKKKLKERKKNQRKRVWYFRP